ncbi:MAG: hypothetical protein JJU37_06330 [Balneolaceae bacterium]|nr:hypothetical protein [Balneolaceae bacterium]
MKNSSATYQRLTKITAVLLLMAFLIPSGLHAKQLVDFCMMDMKAAATEMAADHSCCESEPVDKENEPENHQHHDCGWGFICACDIGESVLSDADWILSTTDAAVELTKKENLTPLITSSERVSTSQNKQLAQHDPPLWLVYDTFLN